MTTQPDSMLLDSRAVAARLGVSPHTLKTWRGNKGRTRLPFVRISGKSVRYQASDVDAFIAARRQPAEEQP